MKKFVYWLAAFVFFALSACTLLERSAPPPPVHLGELPGLKDDGFTLLPNQWRLHPAGRQLPMGDFPVNIAVHPGGRFAAVLHCGYGRHEIIVVGLNLEKIISRTPVAQAFYGITFSADGKKIFCSGADREVVHAYNFHKGILSDHVTIEAGDRYERGIPAGLCVDVAGKTLYAANVWGHRVSVIDLTTRRLTREISLSTNAPPPAPALGTDDPNFNFDEAAVSKRAAAFLDRTTDADPFPYACVLDEKRGRLYVSLWAQASVAVINLKTLEPIARWPVEEHPNEMLLAPSGRRLFVANANRNTVTVLDAATGAPLETLVAEMFPSGLPGSTPNSLALSPDEKTLYVANANINNVAVFDVATPGRSRSLGFIPVGWYPTSVRVTPDGRRLLVANGKGVRPVANLRGPQPGGDPFVRRDQYVGGLLRGTLSVIDLPAREKFEAEMKLHTAVAYRCAPSTASTNTAAADLLRWQDNPVPQKVGGVSPIKYVLYIIKENRTYDQILGDMKEGNGDPALCLFPERNTPNHHRLAREFVLLDNFYVDAEVSADGHEWSMGAYATDFVEKTWPLSYGHNPRKQYPYPSEGSFAIATPAGGYLWDRAKEAGVTFRSYGEFVQNGKTPEDPATTRVAALKGNFDPGFRGFDMDYPDVKRAERFISELRRFETEGEMPRLQILRLPNDHTSGTAFGKPTPAAYLADNDLALGQVVEAVSRSKFWAQTAIFVIEDDAQNGPDHVDAHRSVAFVISPYTRRGAVDSTMYSTSSMLRTMELILGLKPMSQFDAAARPMFDCFQARPDLRPYAAVPVAHNRQERSSKGAYGGRLSAKMDFSREDAIDDFLLNDIIWRSVRGADRPMPAPKRSAFVRAVLKLDDDD